ncbi:hypothetical protein MRBLWO14_001516 [Microbacterium sp. LWO14-1.2]|uniref:hypothetical protein n=1 Tax=Microbacterium sp. LWO14-1.2 TaxID=3135263 RepID=UPI003138F8B4
MRTFAWSLFSAGIALIIAFAILIFESGIIADATGGVGSMTPGQAFVGLGGGTLILGGIALLVTATRRSKGQARPAR